MRLIDADALIEEHCKDCSADIREGCKSDPICASMMCLSEAPTVEDAVAVVRCKDCKHWHDGDCWRLELSLPNDYCSYGERKSDNE